MSHWQVQVEHRVTGTGSHGLRVRLTRTRGFKLGCHWQRASGNAAKSGWQCPGPSNLKSAKALMMPELFVCFNMLSLPQPGQLEAYFNLKLKPRA